MYMLFEYMGMTMNEFLSVLDKQSDLAVREAMYTARDEIAFLEYDSYGLSSDIVTLMNFAETLENELTDRKNAKVPSKLVMIFAYENEFGFVAHGNKTFPFMTLRQCKTVIENIYKDNLSIEKVQLVGRGKYEGTMLTESIEQVLESLT